jgi:hypothetical protein
VTENSVLVVYSCIQNERWKKWYPKKVWLVGKYGRRLGGRHSNLGREYHETMWGVGKGWKLKDTLRKCDWPDNKQKDSEQDKANLAMNSQNILRGNGIWCKIEGTREYTTFMTRRYVDTYKCRNLIFRMYWDEKEFGYNEAKLKTNDGGKPFTHYETIRLTVLLYKRNNIITVVFNEKHHSCHLHSQFYQIFFSHGWFHE